MSDNQERYGQNKSKLSQILNSAITKWDGFIYQGLCAIRVVLEQILENKAGIEERYLNIEGYDDFAILDKDKNILSFHQAKCYKSLKPNFQNDMALMEDKRAYWHEQGVCESNANLYFHCNRTIECSHNVVQYKYIGEYLAVSPTEMINLVDELIDKILDERGWGGSVVCKRNSLISLLNRHVAFLDSESKKGNCNDLQLTIDYSIPFADIIYSLEQIEDISATDRVRNISFYLNLNLLSRILEETDETVDCSKVENFLDAYNKLPKLEKLNFIKRLFPHYDVEGRRTTLNNLTNEDVANYLYNVLTQTEVMNLNRLHWEENEQLYSPSVLGKSKPSKNYCGMIAKNRGNLPPELLRDYRWIVGDVTETIQDLLEEAHLINAIDVENYKSIVKTRKVGLLTIKDKNDGNI